MQPYLIFIKKTNWKLLPKFSLQYVVAGGRPWPGAQGGHARTARQRKVFCLSGQVGGVKYWQEEKKGKLFAFWFCILVPIWIEFEYLCLVLFGAVNQTLAGFTGCWLLVDLVGQGVVTTSLPLSPQLNMHIKFLGEILMRLLLTSTQQ